MGEAEGPRGSKSLGKGLCPHLASWALFHNRALRSGNPGVSSPPYTVANGDSVAGGGLPWSE